MNERVRRWAVPNEQNVSKWVIATAITAVLSLVLTLSVGVFHVGSSNGAMQSQISDLKSELAQKEDISAAEADRRGEMTEMRTIESQQNEIMQLMMTRGKH